MAIYDTEQLLKDTAALMQAKLNDELTCIDADKGDYVLDKINSNAWYFQNLNEEAFSYANFVVWGLYDNPDNTDVTESNNLKTIEVFFEVVIPDDGGIISQNVFYKMLRYTRGLESVVLKNFDKIRGGTKFKVTALSPTSFDLSGKTYRSAGILVKAALSSR